MDEDVLILCLYHVVPLSSHACHMTVNVHRLFMFYPLQHGIDHDKAAGSAHTSTDKAQTEHTAKTKFNEGCRKSTQTKKTLAHPFL